MPANHISDALKAATDTNELIVEAGAIERIPELFRRYGGGLPVVVVADENTFEAAGENVCAALEKSGAALGSPFLFPGSPVLPAEYRHVETVKQQILDRNAYPISVGSGTINDIVKLASHESGRRYIAVATAASVDGYSSYGSAILRDGFKQTMACPAPVAIVADPVVLREAPPAMAAAGYADLSSKLTAGADWIIADILGSDKIDPSIWDMVQTDLRRWLYEPGKLMKGDSQAFSTLFEGLLLTGFAMQAMQSSRPVSGTDHLFSHVWEMQHLEVKGAPVSHGFKVALGTLIGTAFMEVLFSRPIAELDERALLAGRLGWQERSAAVREAFSGLPTVDIVLDESRAKHLSEDGLKKRLGLIRTRWEEMRRRVLDQLVPYPDLKRMYLQAGCPVEPGQIGLDRRRVRETFPLAQMIRNRYTALDLAFDVGWLEECADRVIESKEYL
jgi:glycerol-1-phosphate dehydrogenase [NAD(P)+]